MTTFQQIVFIINIFFLLVVLYISTSITSAGSKFSKNPGDSALKGRLLQYMLKSLVVIVFLAIVMALMNVAASFF